MWRPDLAVEGLSLSTERRDRGRKMDLLARFGVPEYWIVEPAMNTLEIHVLRGAAYELRVSARSSQPVTAPTIDGLEFDTARVFAD
jgi:Uma2 family endonuclease